ncbi:MAG: antibiotic biosynthesis monooxygenase [Bacteroidia bacterium]|nr:antibiotic biosynthesis monooxygenase [Bacteroidia bacterium]
MINRIVRLSFQTHLVDDFLRVFENSKIQIAEFPGCKGLSLLKDANHTNVFYTYSLWETALDLENYRNSELFKATWAATKILFNDKPMAFSTIVHQKVK